jgi:hypothetical protein
MALEQGIDTQVQDKMDAYRSNPQQLMKMYQTNKQLVDLLALQKLKSEKEAAARDIQLQMEQAPGTIKQQREQELMQMTKDELAQQTKGILQQKQQKQQANLQRMAKGKSGLGALAQNRPTPVQTQTPKPMLAGGGIVAFQPGGEVSTSPFRRGVQGVMEDISATTARKKLENQVRSLYGRYGAPIGVFAKQSDRSRAQAKDIINRVNSGELSTEQLQMLVNQFPTFQGSAKQGIMSGAALNVDEMIGAGMGDFTAPYQNKAGDTDLERRYFGNPRISSSSEKVATGNPDLRGYFNPDAKIGERTAVPLDQRGIDPNIEKGITGANRTLALNANMPTDSSGGDPTGFDMKAGITALNVPPSDNNRVADTAVDTAITDVDNQIAGLNAINGGNMGGAEDVLKRGVGIGEDVLGRDDKAAKYAGLEADLAAFDEATYDPEEDRRRQLQAFLIGSAGKTSVGTTLAGGAAAALNEESRQKINSRARMIDRINLSKDAMTSDTDLGKSALSLGNQMFADYNANQRTVMSAAATLGAAKLRAVTDRAKLDFERDKEENTQEYRLKDLKIREANSAIEQARNEQLDLDRRLRGNLTATAKLLEIIQQENENAAKLFGVEDATEQLQFLTPDDEGYEAAKAARNTAVAEANAYAAQRLEEDKVYTQLKTLFGLYFELTGVQDIPGINVDDITKIEPKR